MKIVEYQKEVDSPKAKSFFILSDFHISEIKSLKKLIIIKNKLNKRYLKGQKYDAIFVVGDMIDATNTLMDSYVTKELLSFMSFLGSLAPTYFSIGNHDIYHVNKRKWHVDKETFERKFLREVIKDKNIIFLDNETKVLEDDYTISVLNPPAEYFMESKEKENILLETYQNSFLKDLKKEKVNILLCHYPNVIFTLYKKGYLKNVDLAIAGHNHSGITQFAPLEFILNLFGGKNRGLITPGKSIHLKDTKLLRGYIDLDKKTSLLINPSVTTFANCTGHLKYLDFLFYIGASQIKLNPKKENIVVKKSKIKKKN